MTPVLSELRAPPTPGCFYMVPAIRYKWMGRWGQWPVAGPMHKDDDFFDFPYAHYHVDGRFLTAHQAKFINAEGRSFFENRARGPLGRAEFILGRYPLITFGVDLPKHRPPLIRRKCRYAERGPYQFGDSKQVKELNDHYGQPDAIRRADGRLLCPHRKYDLSQHTPDENGIVTCPLHGLRVRCRAAA